jgi:hypothetical protein
LAAVALNSAVRNWGESADSHFAAAFLTGAFPIAAPVFAVLVFAALGGLGLVEDLVGGRVAVAGPRHGEAHYEEVVVNVADRHP